MNKLLKNVTLSICLGLGGCSPFLPEGGPDTASVEAAPQDPSLSGIELVKVNYSIASQLRTELEQNAFPSFFSGPEHADHLVAPGDVLQIFIWEAPPAVLFGAPAATADGMTAGGTGMITLPNQTVDNEGDINVPFAGTINVGGLALSQVGALITTRLQGKANQPQVLVSLAQNNTQDITVVGNVAHSMEVPINPGGIRLLRAIAMAGGVVAPVEQTSIQLSREGQVATLPLLTILNNPDEDIALQAGDVVTALNQPYSFTVLGATGHNAEINFKESGITLAQAISLAGGADDNRSNPSGVFLFRFLPPDSLSWPVPPHALVQGKVPTIFQFDLRDPATFFAAQAFPMQDHDLLYITNAPSVELGKVLNLVGQIAYPFTTLQTMGVIK
jgi:polysaccharide export outer membrane protein